MIRDLELSTRTRLLRRQLMKKKFSILKTYKAILFFTDAAMATGGFVSGLWLTGWLPYLYLTSGATLGFLIFSLSSIVFFPTYHLYSYNFLFSRREHLKNLSRSFFWSSLAIGITLFFINSPNLLVNHFGLFLMSLSGGALLLLLLSRYLSSHLLNFLMSLGFAVLFVGVHGIVYKDSLPIFMTYPSIIGVCFLFAALLITANRLFLFHIVFNTWFRQHIRRQIIIIGSDSEAQNISENILRNNAPFWIAGTVGPPTNDTLACSAIKKKWLGEIVNLPEIINNHNVDDIIITDCKIDKPTLVSILDCCTSAGVSAWFSPKLLPIIDIKLSPDTFCGQPMIQLCSQKNSRLFNFIKHTVDILAALSLTVVLSPLFLLIALAIKIESKGPVFYQTKAIGKNVAIFLMYKFRSMVVESDNTIHKNYVSQLIKGEVKKQDDNNVLKITEDPRVTRVGKIIRKFSLDELPQLLNVIKTEMSLVGPRPCLPYEFEIYEEWYKKRTSVKPGITGLWQVTGRSEVSFEDMILLDLYYIYNRSVALDFNILFETIFVVIGKKGAY